MSGELLFARNKRYVAVKMAIMILHLYFSFYLLPSFNLADMNVPNPILNHQAMLRQFVSQRRYLVRNVIL